MVCAPRFYASFRTGEAFGQCIKTLEAEFERHMSLIFLKHFGTEIHLEILSDDEDDFAKACLYRIINGIVHYRFAVRTKSVELFQTTVTAAHTGCQE